MSPKKFFVTTPIYYVNDKPHIGHAYTTILADVISRYHRALGEEVFFLTGLDEHGQKVAQAAEKRGVTPQQQCDEMAPRFIELWKRLEIENDDFIRTTEARHARIVQKILQEVYDKGDIYIDEYEGLYSVSEERFITETENETGQFRDVKKLKEKNYFFRMGKYQQQLITYINEHPDFIRPEHRRNEILGFLRQPLEDLCISRPKARMSWGIEIPFDKEYVTYVWFDALINYISVPGYGANEKNFKQCWPADIHLIGKDILTTHAVYWPTMLFSLGIELPTTIFAHGWWLTGASKMSKSLGNVVNPLELIDTYGVDAVRYYLMSEMVLGSDAHFTMELFTKRFNSDLANDYGNLLNRVSGLIQKLFAGQVPARSDNSSDGLLIEAGSKLQEAVPQAIKALDIRQAIELPMNLVRMANRYLEEQAPWKVAKEDMKKAGGILYAATESLRLASIFLSPVMPAKCARVLEVLGATGSKEAWGGLKASTRLQSHEALFPRIEVEKK